MRRTSLPSLVFAFVFALMLAPTLVPLARAEAQAPPTDAPAGAKPSPTGEENPKVPTVEKGNPSKEDPSARKDSPVKKDASVKEDPSAKGDPSAQEDPSVPLRPDLRDELWAMAVDDHESVADAIQDRPPKTTAASRVERLRAIIREHGWPGRALVGQRGARAAWLIAQHADWDVPFQRECLALVEGAYRRGDVDGHDLAYLTDRVAAAEGRPQVYGTQGGHHYTPEQEAAVDARRVMVGLPTLAEFRAMIARGEYEKVHNMGW